MRVLVIGATGRVGRQTVDACLAIGHKVTAFGRSADPLAATSSTLDLVKGDVTNRDDVEAAMPDHDAVILTFGTTPTKRNILHKPNLCEQGTRNVVNAMHLTGVPRLVCMTSIGAGDSAGYGRTMRHSVIEPLVLGRILRDRTYQEEVVENSLLPEWTIVRPTRLSDNAPAPIRYIEDLENAAAPTTISRTDVALFLATLTMNRRFDHKKVLITN